MFDLIKLFIEYARQNIGSLRDGQTDRQSLRAYLLLHLAELTRSKNVRKPKIIIYCTQCWN